MTAKEYLKQYEYMVKRIKRLDAEYEREEELIDAVRSAGDIDGMPHGSKVNKATEDKAIRLADKRAEITDLKAKAVAKRQEVFMVIDKVDGVPGDVLYERYIELQNWEEICVKLHYSWNMVHQYHREALQIVDNIIT